MINRHPSFYKHVCVLAVCLLLSNSVIFSQEQMGSIRGMVYDKDFDVPLNEARVTISELEETATTSDEGNYLFSQVPPGTYTLIFAKEGFTRQVKADVVVSAGQMTEVDIWLTGDFTEMEEVIFQDIQIGTGTEAALLELRIQSPALMDSVSAEYMSLAGTSDAASALNLVAGTTVSEGKYAVVRGLPDRYVTSQMNGVRLPTADLDKRAVQLDQFPAAVIESIQVSKTFTPDQQGDASGGAVNVVLKGIPEKTTFKVSGQYSYNTNVGKRDDFLTYEGGGVSCWADDSSRDLPPLVSVFQDGEITELRDFSDTVGLSPTDAPTDYKWAASGGTNYDFDDFKVGGFASFFYERNSSYYDDGINDNFIVPFPGRPMTPTFGSTVSDEEIPFTYTELFDVTQASQEVQWGGLGTFGVETEDHTLNVLYNFTRDAVDEAVLAEDTRGKANLHTYWPSIFDETYLYYDPYDPEHPGNQGIAAEVAQYRRNETIKYTERSTSTLQFSGRHTFNELDYGIKDKITLLRPELDWGVAFSSARLDEPDKRLFAALWKPNPGSTTTGTHYGWKFAAARGLGNLQRIWKDVTEDSNQFSVNIKFPFEQWNEQEGYFKFGVFNDDVKRDYNQTSFTNFTPDPYEAPWEENWGAVYQNDDLIKTDTVDVDYDGDQKISAGYFMMDMPLNSTFNLIGGARFEQTEIGIENFPDPQVVILSGIGSDFQFDPDYANVDFKQDDVLPSIAFAYTPIDPIIIRGSYSQTVARQTFKELSPITQQEFLGDDFFSGNQNLKMSSLKNYDLRFDWTPYVGGLVSLSYFYKDVKDPIEYVRLRGNSISFIRPFNYPEGQLSGIEIEVRQKLGEFWKELEGISAGTNATLIDSEVQLPKSEAEDLREAGWPEPTRNMTNAPEYLYNIYLTYDFERIGGRLGLFYTVRGDTLVSGQSSKQGSYTPSVFETEYGTLNLSYSQQLGDIWAIKFGAKNLLNPEIQTVYRSEYIGEDVVKTSYTRGMEFSISVSASF